MATLSTDTTKQWLSLIVGPTREGFCANRQKQSFIQGLLEELALDADRIGIFLPKQKFQEVLVSLRDDIQRPGSVKNSLAKQRN